MSSRRLGRLRAVQALFQVDLTGIDWEEALENTLEEDERMTPFMKQLVSGTMEHKEEIDKSIKNSLENWSLERVGNVDRSILRLAVYEIKYVNDIPVNVTINEAIELGKAFGGEDSGRFINGVLSKVLKQ